MKHRIAFLLALAGMAGAGALSAQAAEQLATAPVQYREVAQTYSVDGVVEAARQSTVSAQISGRVKEIAFDVGDRVKKGQVILRIDEREAAQAVAGSEAQLMQAQAAMHNAQANYERARQLFAQKFISQAALDKAQADYQVALAQAAASKAGAGQSALTHGYTTVVAPYSGIVAARLVEVGEMVTVGKPLMTGFDPSEMRAIVSVPQDRLAELGARPQASVEAPSLKRWLPAASVTVQPAADARTHSTQLRVYLPTQDSVLKQAAIYPGMFVRVHFVTGKASKLLAPASAIVRRSEVVAVYVVDQQGAVKLRQVRLGDPAGQDEVEVLAGLNAGERVALDPIKAGMTKAVMGDK